MMRVSTYEIVLPLRNHAGQIIDGYSLWINGLYGAIDIYENSVRSDDILSIPLEKKMKMIKRGHLTKKTVKEEMDDLRILSKIYEKVVGRCGMSLVIMPTYDCNFRCPYCFEKHRLNNGDKWLEHVIDKKMVDAIFNVMQTYKEKGYDLGGCTFYGGEPLLKKNVDIIKYICSKAKENNMGLSAITNGYELNYFKDVISRYKFNDIQITLDGVNESNDKRRIHKDGLPTYDKIIDNIELALSSGVDVVVRINVDAENINGIGELISYLNDNKFQRKNNETNRHGTLLYYVKATTTENDVSSITDKDVFYKLLDMGMSIFEAMKIHGQYSIIFNELVRMIKKDGYWNFSPFYCAAESGMIVLDPFGKVYSCWDSVGKRDDIVGVLDCHNNDIVYNFAKPKWRMRTVDRLSECACCPYVFVCKGGCASRAYNKYGDYSKSYCGEVKEIFPFVASCVIGNNYLKNNNDTELSLSLLEPISKLSLEERETIISSNSQRDIFEIAKNIGLWNHDFKKNNLQII